jgi:hypothetical protein
LLYLVRFPGFAKIGRTLAQPAERLYGHLAYTRTRLLQVVEGRHDRVAAAEQRIIATFRSELLTEPHEYMERFGIAETFNAPTATAIGDLRGWVGRGARDVTAEFRRASVAKTKRRTG